MMRSVNALIDCRVVGRDGELGSVRDVYFDDQRWAIRYLIVRAGNWLFGREVLVSPVMVRDVTAPDAALHVDLTRAQIQASPDIDTQKPVSRQMEAEYGAYYDYPPYWAYGYGGALWGWGPLPTSRIEQSVREDMVAREQRERDAQRTGANQHLRSAEEVIGYAIEATDGSIGHVEDLLFDEDSWAVRHVIVDTRNWWPGKHVVISPQRFKAVSWPERSVWVDLKRDEIKASPEFDSDTLHERAEIRAKANQRAAEAGAPPGT